MRKVRFCLRGRVWQGQSAAVTGRAEMVATDSPAAFDAAVARAATTLREDGLVVLPTETVYGLAGNACSSEAVEQIFAVKGRPTGNPVIAHVDGLAMARECVAPWPEAAARLARAFWPGPLTLVLLRSEVIADEVTAGGKTVGVRWPSHPLMRAVISACGFPLAAPSANRSGQLSPTCAEHAAAQLGEAVEVIVDGGQANVGIESTVVDVTGPKAQVLRPGMISAEVLAAALPGVAVVAAGATEGVLRSPGMLERHYAPTARLLVRRWRDEEDLEAQVAVFRAAAAYTFVIAHTNIPPGTRWGGVSVIPRDAEAYARALYAELHRCDAEGAELIVVEAVPEGDEWAGVADRLARAGA